MLLPHRLRPHWRGFVLQNSFQFANPAKLSTILQYIYLPGLLQRWSKGFIIWLSVCLSVCLRTNLQANGSSEFVQILQITSLLCFPSWIQRWNETIQFCQASYLHYANWSETYAMRSCMPVRFICGYMRITSFSSTSVIRGNTASKALHSPQDTGPWRAQ